MKNIIATIALATAALGTSLTAGADGPSREHRSMWMTPYLSNNWPSSAITTSNAESFKNILRKRLVKFKENNINVLYYHCRSNCDATYESSYEPWSAQVSGKRGVAPAFDPFGFLVEEAHAQGIEVYAWINPYRYCSTSGYGEGELNYENSHPDWLIKQTKETILNPGLEEVKQRIVDVISEIVTKYDVDGVLYDDYFYTNGTPMDLDKAQYDAYKAQGGKLSQADWRRANVNEMVHRVSTAIKGIKPWVSFGISPAGVSSPPNVTTEYGLPAAPGGGDWQYNGIYSDPLAWFKAGDLDFMSPQIYWPSRFDALNGWWQTAAQKYGRHCYPSIDLADISTIKYEEVAREINVNRGLAADGASGIVFFHYGNLVNYSEKYNGKTTEMTLILGQEEFNNPVLMPLRPWTGNPAAATTAVSNVRLDGTMLTWDAPTGGKALQRYAVYSQPINQSSIRPELTSIVYDNRFDTGADGASRTWYVAVYDRFANLYTPLGVGATMKTGTAPQLVYPADGETPVDLFDFQWNASSSWNKYTVQVAEDASFNSIVGNIEVEGATKASVTALPALEAGKTYWWRVFSTDVNRVIPVSATRSFKASRIALTSPQHNTGGHHYNTVFTYTPAVEGAEYTVEIARSNEFSTIEHSGTVTTTTYTVPERTLVSGRQYWARVRASKDGATSTSQPVAFTTVDRSDYTAPVLTNPTADGQTLHVNQTIDVLPWEGMTGVQINISATNTFPTRSSYVGTLSDFATSTPEMGSIKIAGKALEDGKTYYLRSRGTYILSTATATQYTDYTPVMSFVYSQEAGVSDVTADAQNGPVTYYSLQGCPVDSPAPGTLVIRRQGAKAAKVIVK